MHKELKMKKTKKIKKVRNMIALHCWNRKSGVHEKTNKAKRRNEKISLLKEE